MELASMGSIEKTAHNPRRQLPSPAGQCRLMELMDTSETRNPIFGRILSIVCQFSAEFTAFAIGDFRN
jgi:hypothetical protein